MSEKTEPTDEVVSYSIVYFFLIDFYTEKHVGLLFVFSQYAYAYLPVPHMRAYFTGAPFKIQTYAPECSCDNCVRSVLNGMEKWEKKACDKNTDGNCFLRFRDTADYNVVIMSTDFMKTLRCDVDTRVLFNVCVHALEYATSVYAVISHRRLKNNCYKVVKTTN